MAEAEQVCKENVVQPCQAKQVRLMHRQLTTPLLLLLLRTTLAKRVGREEKKE